MQVHLLDGTYELFRHYFALPGHVNDAGLEVDAVRGVLRSVLAMLEGGVTHLAVATDHVVESFRNELWADYKTGAGIEPDLLAQFGPLEESLRAMGVVVWAMEEHEADDALAAGAALAAGDGRVERVFICTPDKDLAQCVVGERIVMLDRRHDRITDEDGVLEKFGVPPASIPDYLALVGDSADGYPGLPGWGAKSSATVLRRYGHIEYIPQDASDWDVAVRGAERLANILAERLELALLFRRLARLVTEAPVSESVDELRWSGPAAAFPDVCRDLDAAELAERTARFAESR